MNYIFRIIRGGSFVSRAQYCRSAYRSNAEPGDHDDGVGPISSEKSMNYIFRIIRGGSFVSRAQYCRSAYRSNAEPGDHDDGVGFRLVRRKA
jgi:formylglycine-generating enzyme required for sulfatase activity